jgi:Co/Zn/Cd efflux system component
MYWFCFWPSMCCLEVVAGILANSTALLADSLDMLVGAGALAANVSCLWLLQKQRRGDVHIRASWIFTRTDALANLGSILGGGLVLATRNALPDLIVGAAISMVVLYGSFEIIRDAALEPSEAGAKQT